MTLDVQALGRALTNVIPPVGERIGGWYAADVAREYEREVARSTVPDRADTGELARLREALHLAQHLAHDCCQIGCAPVGGRCPGCGGTETAPDTAKHTKEDQP